MAEIVDVDPRGDVVLVCGSQFNEARFRVSSAILSGASPVFRALLSPRFREGTELATANYVEVPLPDDSGAVTVILLNVLHVHNDDVPDSLSPSQVLGVATLADKYGCATAFKHIARLWLMDYESETNASMLKDLLTASYFFKLQRNFESISKSMVLNSPGPLEVNSEALPEAVVTVLAEIDEQRSLARLKVRSIIDDRIEWLVSGTCTICQHHAYRVIISKFIETLKCRGIWGDGRRSEKSVEEVLKIMEELDCDVASLDVELQFCGRCPRFTADIDTQLDLSGEARRIREDIAFPCFSCHRNDFRLVNACDHKPS